MLTSDSATHNANDLSGGADLDLADGMSIEVIRTPHDLGRLAPDYERLHRVSGNTSPFAQHDWDCAWCGHFLNLDPRIEDRLSVLIVRDLHLDCVAIVPLVFSHRRIGLFRFVSGALLGADPSTTEYRSPEVESGLEAVVARLVRHWLSGQREWDWISWSGVTGQFADALAAGSAQRFAAEPPGHVLELAPTWEEFRNGLKRNIRESLRHCYNSLKRDGHAFEFVVARDRGEVGVALDRFLELHAMRADHDTAIKHPNHFTSVVSRKFLYDVCDRFAARDLVRIFQLKIGGSVVAMRIGFVIGSELYLYYSGYDPLWGRYSVMTTTVAESLKYAMAHGCRTANLSRGSDVSKLRWGPSTIDFKGAIEPRDRLSSRLAYRLYVDARSQRGLPGFVLKPLSLSRRTWK